MQDLLGVFADTIRIATFQDARQGDRLPQRIRRVPRTRPARRLRVG